MVHLSKHPSKQSKNYLHSNTYWQYISELLESVQRFSRRNLFSSPEQFGKLLTTSVQKELINRKHQIVAISSQLHLLAPFGPLSV